MSDLRMIRAAITWLVFTMAGCWPVVTVPARPSAHGTWTGVAQAIILYDKHGDPYEAVAIQITSGPRLEYPDGTEYRVPANDDPILLDEKGEPLPPGTFRTGQHVEVSGMMIPDVTATIPGAGNLSAKPGRARILGLYVRGQGRVLLAPMSLLVFGEQPAPAIRPAEVDLSSPQSALLSYVDAIEQGDFGAYRRIIAPQSEDERRALEQAAMAHLAAQELLLSTEDRLGSASATRVRQVLGGMGLGPDKDTAESLREAMEGEIWHVNRDDAVLGEISPEIHFRRIDGEWRLLLSAKGDAQELGQRIERMRQLTEMIQKITDSVDSGRISSPDDIVEAIAGLVPVVRAGATTEPARN